MTEFSRMSVLSMIRARLVDTPHEEEIVSNVKFSPLGRRFFKLDLFVKDLSEEVIKQLVGIEGYFFKEVTERHRLDLIWHNQHTGFVEIFGPHLAVFRGMSELQRRLNLILRNQRKRSSSE